MTRSGIITLVAVLVGITAFYLALGFTGGFTRGFTGVGGENGCPDHDLACGSSPDEPVPNVVGMSVEEACQALERSYYLGRVRATTNSGDLGPGRIVKQDPEAGSKGGFTTVRLRVSEPLPDRLPKGCRRIQAARNASRG